MTWQIKYKKIVIFFVLTAFLIFYLILSELFQIAIPCLFQTVTGLYCPGCGITRSLQSLVHLEFYQAFRYNSLVLALLPLFGVLLILEYIGRKRNLSKRFFKATQICYIVMIVLLVAYGILRNLPAFSALAPTEILTKHAYML